MWFVGFCLFGLHRRIRREVWREAGDWRSCCGGCGKPMIKKAGKWDLS
jgi:hypothetical protein